MRATVLLTTLLLSSLAHAGNIYIVDGKAVEQGDAEEAIRKNPKLQVMKVNATWVTVSPKTGNFKKFDDVSSEQLKKAVSALK